MALESLFGGVLNIIPQLFYLLSMALLSIIDVFQLLMRKLAGLDTYYVDGSAQTGDIVSDFLTGIMFGGYPILSSVFLGLIILGAILLFLSTIVAIIRNEYTTEKAENSKSKIIGKAFKSIIFVAIIPVVCIFGVYLANIVLVAVDSATTYNTNYANTLDKTKLEAVSVRTQSLPGLNNASTAQKTYITYNMFGAVDDEGRPYGTTNTTFSGTIFKASAYWANRVRTSANLSAEDIASGKINYAELIKTEQFTDFDGLFSDPTGNAEIIASKIDIAFADNVLFAEGVRQSLNFKNEQVKAVNNYDWSPWADNSGTTYTFANKYDVQLVWYYYDLWSFNYVIALGAAIIMVTIFVNIIFGLMRRLIELVGLFMVAPPLISLMPLDEEKAYKEWRKSFISKTLMAYGAIGGMNIVMLILPELQRISFFNNEFLDLIANTLLIIVALLTVKSFVGTVSRFVGGDDAINEGKDVAKEAGETVAKGAKVAAGVGGLALGAGALAGKVALGGAMKVGQVAHGAYRGIRNLHNPNYVHTARTALARFEKRDEHRAEAKEKTYEQYRHSAILGEDMRLQTDEGMRQLKLNDSAAYNKILESNVRKSFEKELEKPGTVWQDRVDAEYKNLQANTKVTNKDVYAGTQMATWMTKAHDVKQDWKDSRVNGGLVAFGKKYIGETGGYVKEHAISLGKPLVHQGQLVLQSFGDILLDNNFAKGLRDGDTKDEVYLRLFKNMTKKDADKAKEKANKESDNRTLVSMQKEAFKQAFKEAMQETK
ncbi:MAG: hypothetical protein IJF22_01210 [Clostridia bacterium]|nr:hypothetical protein [Clostridia bacterium]